MWDGRSSKQRVWLGTDRYPGSGDRRRHAIANAQRDGYGDCYSSTSESHADSDSDCYRDLNSTPNSNTSPCPTTKGTSNSASASLIGLGKS